MSSRNIFYIGLAAVVISLYSCSSAVDVEVEPYTPEYDENLLNQIEAMMGDNEPELVLQTLNSLETLAIDDGVYREKILSFEEPAKELLKANYQKALNRKDYLTAAELSKSLDAVGWDFKSSTEAVYLEYVAAAIAEGDLTPALNEFQERIIQDSPDTELSPELAALIFDAAVENRNSAVLDFLITEELIAGEEELKTAVEVISRVFSKSEMISGTVTLVVDKGIKLQRGRGYQDRVIGSGFFIDQRGYILTNYHVIESEVDPEYEGYSRLSVQYDSTEARLPAEVVGWDKSLDLALVKVGYEPPYFFSLPADRDYFPGEEIFAIGSPGGLDKTITAGIISAPADRRLLALGDTIQVDVPINSGNSGGPVVDANGELAGVVFAGIEQFEGVNFVIPVKWVRHNISELYRRGRNRQSWLGLAVHENRKAMEVIYVMPGTNAFKAGVKNGDIIKSIDGLEVRDVVHAQEAVMKKRPGTLLKLGVERGEEDLDILLTVDDRDDVPMRNALRIDSNKNLMPPFFGMSVELGEGSFFDQDYRITRIYQGMAADELGLSVNDPFTLVNWQVLPEQQAIVAGLRIKKRKAGFLTSSIQMGNVLDISNTL